MKLFFLHRETLGSSGSITNFDAAFSFGNSGKNIVKNEHRAKSTPSVD
jgi:hypothetical protein